MCGGASTRRRVTWRSRTSRSARSAGLRQLPRGICCRRTISGGNSSSSSALREKRGARSSQTCVYFVLGTDAGSVLHGVGFHFAPFASRLNCVLRYSGAVRYVGSSRIDETTSHTSPFGCAGRRSKCSSSDAFSLYGTPLLRRYPSRKFVV